MGGTYTDWECVTVDWCKIDLSLHSESLCENCFRLQLRNVGWDPVRPGARARVTGMVTDTVTGTASVTVWACAGIQLALIRFRATKLHDSLQSRLWHHRAACSAPPTLCLSAGSRSHPISISRSTPAVFVHPGRHTAVRDLSLTASA